MRNCPRRIAAGLKDHRPPDRPGRRGIHRERSSMVQQVEEGTHPEIQEKTPTPWALDNLPPFPVVATRLAQMLFREDVDITEAGRMISADPVFASRLLQMANSPLFALERQV